MTIKMIVNFRNGTQHLKPPVIEVYITSMHQSGICERDDMIYR